MTYAALFIFGLAAGSFLNVLALRYNPGRFVFSKKSLGGRSRCPKCKKTLRWFELIPVVSFLILRGKCGSCGKEISLQYPIVELLSGALFASTAFFLKNLSFGIFWETWIFIAIWILAFWILLLISVIDLRHYLVPDELTFIIGFLGLAAVALKTFFTGWIQPYHEFFSGNYALLFQPFLSLWLNHILGLFAGGIFFLVPVVLTRGKAMGMGDVKLAGVLGLLLGWPDVGLMIFFAFVLGSLWSLAAIVAQKKGMKSIIPFAPFIALGTFVAVFFGHASLDFYFSLFAINAG